MAEPTCRTCKLFVPAIRSNGGECRDKTKRIFIHNSTPMDSSDIVWIGDAKIYTCLNHKPKEKDDDDEAC